MFLQSPNRPNSDHATDKSVHFQANVTLLVTRAEHMLVSQFYIDFFFNWTFLLFKFI
jgi:hypothetical protein